MDHEEAMKTLRQLINELLKLEEQCGQNIRVVIRDSGEYDPVPSIEERYIGMGNETERRIEL